MSNELKPLYALTVEEFTELNRQIVKREVQDALLHQGQSKPRADQDIIFMDEACELVGYTKPTMYSKISRYEIPVLSRGKPLTFSKKALIQWIHEGKPNVVDELEASNYLKSPRL